jgi:hypothetical protein
MQKAYPVYDQQYQDSVATVRRYLETLTNLQTVGRNGLHRYNNQDHSMLTGVYAARNIIGERYDVWSINTEMEYLEERSEGAATVGDRSIPTTVAKEERSFLPSPEEIIEAAFARLDPLALGIAVGVVSGLVLFVMTAVLLLKREEPVGPTLTLLGQYFFGFKVTWVGAFVGLVEAGISGFTLAYFGAWLRNWGMAAYAAAVRRRAEAEMRRDLLDKV